MAIKIAELGKNDIHIGFFVDEEDAARAYDVTLLGIFGRGLSSRHRTNFDMEEYTFDKIPALRGLNREGIREELESWFGPSRFTVFQNGAHLYSHQRPGYKMLEAHRLYGNADGWQGMGASDVEELSEDIEGSGDTDGDGISEE